MCEKEIQLIAIICLFDFVCGTQNLVSSFDFQEGHLDNPVLDLPTNCYKFIGFSMDEVDWIYHHKWMKHLDLPHIYRQV